MNKRSSGADRPVLHADAGTALRLFAAYACRGLDDCRDQIDDDRAKALCVVYSEKFTF